MGDDVDYFFSGIIFVNGCWFLDYFNLFNGIGSNGL